MNETMDDLSHEDQDEYNGLRDCEEGRSCRPGKSEAYYRGYGHAYAREQQDTARGLANG